MKVSVIIPTKNRFQILEETLLCLSLEQSYLKKEAEVIIVNDGDAIPGSLSSKIAGMQIIKNRGHGAGNARNTGAGHATGDLLLFLDDDMEVMSDCIARHIANHEKHARSLVSGTWEYSQYMKTEAMRTPFGRFKITHDYKPVETKNGERLSEGVYRTSSLATFNLSITRADFKAAGGFNTGFPYAGCEDQEFTMRAAAKGFQLIVDNSIVCRHNEKDRLSMDEWMNRQYTGVQGFALLCELFPFRKKDRLYLENTPVGLSDPSRIKLKKAIKYLMSRRLMLYAARQFTKMFTTLGLPDHILFRLYNVLCGLYIYRGFRHAYRKLHK
ncbi:MAG: glycosyltransferase [Bacteroidia bacterium]|nr:glycosyltransferase [Bacteroidia bacterium]